MSGEDDMLDVEQLRKNIQFMGHNPSEEFLNKCLELCKKYHLSEEELVDQWVAFSLTNFKNIKPTLDCLDLMVRKDLSERNKKQIIEIQEEPSNPDTPLPVTTPKKIRQLPSQNLKDDISASPGPQMETYSKRNERSKVVYKHGSDTTFNPCFSNIKVKLVGDEGMSINTRYMFEMLLEKRKSIADVTTFIASIIAESHNIELPEKMSKSVGFNDDYLYGRITCDCDAKLNVASVLLEMPSGDVSIGETVVLNLSQVKTYSIFPGQVVIAKGAMFKERMNVKELYTTNNKIPTSICNIPESLQIIVAAGPFSVKGDLNYEPLQDLLKYVLETKPHLLIMTGPFVDSDNDFVCNGNMTESYDTFFQNLVASVMAPLAETNVSVVFVASSKDLHHHIVYPTPPYKLKKKYPNLLCAPDPCQLNVHGLIISITTMDILFHIGKQELCWPNIQGDRMARLSQHLLSQLCFYPLYPSENVCIDYNLFEKYGVMETMPHLLIVPSMFKFFVKKVQGCTVVNPEKLVKGYAGGTFARLNVSMKENVDISCEIIRI